MSSLSKSTHIDRDDFDADHYADFMRDIHRSRLTLEQLDIAQRQYRRKEKHLTHIHGLKMKEHTRVKNEFIRKIEQDLRISNLPDVRQTLLAQRRKRFQPSSPVPNEDKQEEIKDKTPSSDKQSKRRAKANSPRTERRKANLDKFNHSNTLLG